MNAGTSQSGPIVVYGASGYTGRLVAAELARRDAEFVVAGRDRAKLDALAAGLEVTPRVAPVALDDAHGLSELLADAGAVIACAGPFTLHGGPLIAAAAETGTHYVDTTGEQPFIRAAFDRFGAIAEGSGAALVSGMGFDYAPGDLIAALTGRALEGRIEELTLAYSIRGFGPTRGTALSALEMISAGDVEWRNGAYRDSARSAGRGHFDFPSPLGRRRVGRYPAGEQITVPRHLDVATVRTVIDMRSVTPPQLGPLAAPAMTATGYLMDTPARALAAKLIARLPEGPDPDARRAVRFTVVCDARSASASRRGIVRGGDIYGITAVSTVEGALRMAEPGYDRSGALAPAQAYDPASFLEALRPHGITLPADRAAARGGGTMTDPEDEEAGYPCPACGKHLYAWTSARHPVDRSPVVLDHCESCGLIVTRGVRAARCRCRARRARARWRDDRRPQPRELPGWDRRARLGRSRARPHAACTSTRVRRSCCCASRGFELLDARTPLSRRSYALMLLTMINAFTLRDNFVRNARAGRLPPGAYAPATRLRPRRGSQRARCDSACSRGADRRAFWLCSGAWGDHETANRGQRRGRPRHAGGAHLKSLLRLPIDFLSTLIGDQQR